MSVCTPCLAYNEMSCKWDLIQCLLGGTDAMRAASTKWLPIESKEKRQDYHVRLDRSFLYEGFKDTIKGLSAKPFVEPVTMNGDLPERLQLILENVDGTGADITQFARALFEDGITYGLTHVLVDFPKVDAELTLAEESKLTPTWVQVSPPNLIGWKLDGTDVIEIRVKECRIVETADYEQKKIEYIRVYTKTSWTLFEVEGDKQTMVSNGVNSLGRVPLVTIYFSIPRQQFVADPPFEDLAWKNLEHWQSASDQSNILRFARCGILHGKGFTKQEQEALVISPNTVIWSQSKDAILEHVEHKGTALKSGQEHLDHLEAQMEVLGLRPLVERSSDSTATGKKIDERRTETEIMAWVRSVANGLLSCMKLSAEWTKEALSEDVNFEVYNDFSLSVRGTEDGQLLLAARKTIPPQISHETYINELKRRGVLSEKVESVREQELIAAELMVVSESNDDGPDDSSFSVP